MLLQPFLVLREVFRSSIFYSNKFLPGFRGPTCSAYISISSSFFDNLINDYGENYILNLLDEENVGNCNGSFIYKNKYYSANELFHIKFLSLIKGHTNLNSESIICEIGPGYGSFASKLIKSFNSKVVLIDLPESNFLNAFYLKKIFLLIEFE